MTELKPCPFCGSKPVCFVEGQTTVMSEPYVRAIVRCTNCEARIQLIKDGYVPAITVKNMALEEWNRRADND